MDFKQIRTFVTLAEHLHFGQAAEQLRIAQPHVSRRIKQLEEELDLLLFYRNKRNVKLTEAGVVFLAEARTLLKDADMATKRARETARGRRGRLNVSLVTSAMLGTLPSILGQFHRSHPEVQLSFTELGSVLQIAALGDGSADVAFIYPPAGSIGAFDHVPIERETLVAALPTTHPLAQRSQIRLTEFAGEPWVMFPREESAPIYDRIIAICHKAGFSPNIVHVAGPIHTRLGLVAAGFGVLLLNRSWRKAPFPGIAYIPVEPTASFDLGCYWRRDDRNPILKAFTDVVRQNRHERAPTRNAARPLAKAAHG